MLGDFLTRLLLMFLGYAYPAFECYKTVEKNRIEIEQLRFWCQYWIIVAIITVTERFGDVFISWLPMYGEIKLAFIIYLWHPKTKGTNYVYETFLRPYVAKHETDIDRSILELRARAWDLVIFYWQNFAKYGQTTFFQILQYMAAQTSRINNNNSHIDQQTSSTLYYRFYADKRKFENDPEHATKPAAELIVDNAEKATPQSSDPAPTPTPTPTPAPPPIGIASMHLSSKKQSPKKMNRSIAQEPKVDTVKEHLPKSEAIVVTETTTKEVVEEEPNTIQEDSTSTNPQEINMDDTLRSALTRLRRSPSRPQQ